MIAQKTLMTALASQMTVSLHQKIKGIQSYDSNDSTLKNNINNRYNHRFFLNSASQLSFLCIGITVNKKPLPKRPPTPYVNQRKELYLCHYRAY